MKKIMKTKNIVILSMVIVLIIAAGVLSFLKIQKIGIFAAKSNKKVEVKKEVKKEEPKEEVPKDDDKNKEQVQTPPQTVTPTPLNNYKEFFANDVFVGDSITQGISYYEFADESHVCAKLGISLLKVDSLIEQGAKLNPKNIYLLLGINDLSDKNATIDTIMGRYQNVLDKTKSLMPNAHIYVETLTPILPKAERSNSGATNERITQFNAAVKNLVVSENVGLLDINSLLNNTGETYFETDGEHFKKPFYPYWLNYIEANIKQ